MLNSQIDLGLALCFLTYPVKTGAVSDQSQEIDNEAFEEAHIEVEDQDMHSSVNGHDEETVIINDILGYLNTSHHTEKHVGAESVFYCSEGCFVLNKNTCSHKHL